MKAIARVVTYDHIRRFGFMRTADGRTVHFHLSALPLEVKQPIIELSRVFNRRSRSAPQPDSEEWEQTRRAVKQALVGQHFALEIRPKAGGKLGAVPRTVERVNSAAPGERPTHGPTSPLGAANYKEDPIFETLESCVTRILEVGVVVAPVELFVRMGWLKAEDYVRWRTGTLGCLEEVILPDRSKCNRMLRLLTLLAEELNLVPTSATSGYVHPSTGRPLRFTKTQQPHLEQRYARHWERVGDARPLPQPGVARR